LAGTKHQPVLATLKHVIDPRTLLKDFCEAKNKYFAELKQEGENSKIGKKFTKAFEAILKRKKR
jgi:hypothetical protein